MTPGIVEVVEGAGVELRRAGRELVGLCPFHADKTPSLTVNPEKNLWHCFSCNEGGDAIAFVRKLHGVGFKEALKLLNIEKSTRPTGEAQKRRERAKQIETWARRTANKIRDALRDVGDQAYIISVARSVDGADDKMLDEEENSLRRQWTILSRFEDDLNRAKTAVQLWRMRADVEAFADLL